MRVELAYGDGGLPVELPDDSDVLEPVVASPLPDFPAALRAAIASPIGAPPLSERVGPDDHVTIVFSDNTRPVPSAILAPALLEALAGAGVPDEQITLLVGGGLHAPMTRAQMDGLLGPDVTARYRTVAHDARDPDQQVFLERYPGEPRGGIYLNAAFMQASVRIVTGFVEPHLFAGYSGGGKGVFPGVAAAHNIMRNHGVANLAHPRATYCVAEGNPVFEDVRRIALRAGVDFLCDVTLDAQKRVTGVFCGDLVAAHDAAIAQVDRQALRPIAEPYDIVVGTNCGYPADLNLYQSIKGSCRRGSACGRAATSCWRPSAATASAARSTRSCSPRRRRRRRRWSRCCNRTSIASTSGRCRCRSRSRSGRGCTCTRRSTTPTCGRCTWSRSGT